ncbi:MAG: hypothetical protein ACRC9V_09965 [Aeromonas sp.]
MALRAQLALMTLIGAILRQSCPSWRHQQMMALAGAKMAQYVT